MKLYVKEKFFSWVKDFSVYDASGCEKYHVNGEFLSLRNKMHVRDAYGAEKAFIYSELFTFLPRFVVEAEGREVCRIVKEFTFFRPSYRIEGKDWTIEGDFWNHDYEITGPYGRVATVHKEWFTLGDAYELDIAGGEDEIAVLAALLAIDCVVAASSAAAATAASN